MAVTHAWLSRERQVTPKNEVPKRSRASQLSRANVKQEIYGNRYSYCKMHRGSWDWRRDRQKTGSRVEENAAFSIQLFLARRLHCITIGTSSFTFLHFILYCNSATNLQCARSIRTTNWSFKICMPVDMNYVKLTPAK